MTALQCMNYYSFNPLDSTLTNTMKKTTCFQRKITPILINNSVEHFRNLND